MRENKASTEEKLEILKSNMLKSQYSNYSKNGRLIIKYDKLAIDIILTFNIKTIEKENNDKEILIYNKGGYIDNYNNQYSESHICFIVRSLLKSANIISKNIYVNEIISAIKDYSTIRYNQFDKFDKNIGWTINYNNGFLHIKNANDIKFVPHEEHDPDYYLSLNQLEYDYDPGAVDNYNPLEHVYIQDRETFHMVLGSCLFYDIPNDNEIFNVGSTDTGKTTIFEFVKSIIGRSKANNINLSQLEKDNFMKATLNGKHFVVLNEKENTWSKLDTELLKNRNNVMDDYSGHLKYGGYVNFSFKTRFIHTVNRLPMLTDYNDNAAWRRIIIIRWIGRIKNIKKSFCNDFINDKKKMSALNNIMIEGFLKLLENDFKYPEELTNIDKKELWNKLSDPTSIFIYQYLDFDSESKEKIRKLDLYNMYINWCINEKLIKENMLEYEGFKKRIDRYLVDHVGKENLKNYSKRSRIGKGKNKEDSDNREHVFIGIYFAKSPV